MSEREVGSSPASSSSRPENASVAPVDIESIAHNVERTFKSSRRVLSFAEYLELVAGDVGRYTRDASRYLRDVFDHFGTRKVEHPWGEFTRWNLVQHEQHRPLELEQGVDENGVASPTARKDRLRARVSQFYFGDRVEPVTPAELEAAHHEGHEPEELEAEPHGGASLVEVGSGDNPDASGRPQH